MRPRRIIVIGRTGSGKSSLAAQLAARLDIPFVPTDGLFWTEDWRRVPMADLRPWLTEACDGEAWVTDGNFVGERGLLWARAELAVWLDPPAWLSILRVIRRNLGWWLLRQPVWGKQRMTLSRAVGGVRYAIAATTGRRQDYAALLAEFPNLAVVQLKSGRDVTGWLKGL